MVESSGARRDRAWVALCALLIFFASFGYRFLSLKLTDDDYQFFAVGRQIAVFGEWPVRDLVDEGRPLHNLVSAALQGIFGYRLIGEVIFDLVMLSAAAALAFLLAVSLSRSPVVASVVSVLAVVMAPRLYDYPKAIVPLVALWLCFRYVDRPSRRRASVLGVFTAVAFLYRHDLGAYAGAASIAALAIQQLSTGSRAWAPFVAYAGSAAAGVLPFVLLLELHGGVVSHVAASRRFVQREVARSADARPAFTIDRSRPLLEKNPGLRVNIRWAEGVTDAERVTLEETYGLRTAGRSEGRTRRYVVADAGVENLRAIVLDPRVEDTANIDRAGVIAAPNSLAESARRYLRAPAAVAIAPGVLTRRNAVAWLYYLVLALPYVALAVLGVRIVRRRPVADAYAKVFPALVLCAGAAPLLLRGNLYENTRLADMAFPTAVAGAWLLAASLRGDRPRWAVATGRAVALVVLIVTIGSVAAYGNVVRRMDDAVVVLSPPQLAGELSARGRALLASPPPLTWLSKETGMRGAVEYLRQCTAPEDRVFVYGYYPDIVYFSGRALATDRAVVLRGFGTTSDEQRRTIGALQKGAVPIALVEVEAVGGTSSANVLDSSLALIDAYLLDRYRLAGTTGFGASTWRLFNVWVHKTRIPSGTYAPDALPCFGER